MTTFENWCALRGLQPVPVRPVDVANFVFECSALGIETLWPIIGEVSRAHYLKGLSDPTLSVLVTNAINDVTKIEPPRSWPASDKALFLRLPYDVQTCVLSRETDREKTVRRALNEASAARKELAAIQKPAKATNGTQSHAAA